mgnify:CR=1 FL=1
MPHLDNRGHGAKGACDEVCEDDDGEEEAEELHRLIRDGNLGDKAVDEARGAHETDQLDDT